MSSSGGVSRPRRSTKQPKPQPAAKREPAKAPEAERVVVVELMGWRIEHELLDSAEAEQVLNRYKATRNQLPKILVTDPVVRKMGAKPGDIIKITRTSPTAGLTVYYRVVEEA